MAKKAAAKKKPHSAADHAQFQKDLLANDEARRALAGWLTQRGWIVEPLAPMTVAETPAEWAKHSDSGDVWAVKPVPGGVGVRSRFEVKQRTINFTNKLDFPFPDCVVCRCSGFDRAVHKPAFVILFNQRRDCAAVIDASKWQTWRKENKTDTRHDDLTQAFYVCDLDAVSFQQIPYEFTKAGAFKAEQEAAKVPMCPAYHADPKSWARDTSGERVRVTCKTCGRFIGYEAPK